MDSSKQPTPRRARQATPTSASVRSAPGSEPSSLLERMVEELGGWGAVREPSQLAMPAAVEPPPAPHPAPGVVVLERYELSEPLADALPDTFRALDRTTRQDVLVRFLVDVPIDATLTHRFAVARSVSHSNVCRVHDLVPTPWGPAVIMEGLAGETLATHVARARAEGRFGLRRFRRIAADVFEAVAAIHAHGAVHGGLDARSVLVTERKAVVLDLGFRGPVLPPGTNQTLADRAADDVRAAALICWEMWCRTPSDDADPRARPLRLAPVGDLPTRLAPGEVRNLFRALSFDRTERPTARHVRFTSPENHTPPALRHHHRPDAGPPPGSLQRTFDPEAQALLVTYSATAPAMIGRILPLDHRTMRIGRSRSLELVVDERTVSYEHATLTWQNGPWIVEDGGSTNGTFVEQDDARAPRAVLRYGAELQLGEMRVMLVGFREGSAHHRQALAWLAERDPLTGLLGTEALRRGLEQDAELGRWADLPLHVASYRLVHDGQRTEGRLALEELLALRRIGRSIAELTDNLLLSVSPVVAGRPVVSPPGAPDLGTEIVVSLVGPTRQEAQNLVDLVVADARSRLSPRFTVEASLKPRAPGEPVVFGPPPAPPAPPRRGWAWRR